MATKDKHQDQSVTLTSQCLCKAHTFTTTVPTSRLPLDASCCHCTSCRHSTGAMYTMDVDWPGDTKPIQESGLKVFDFTSRVKILFCGTCGTPMFFQSRYKGPDGPVTTGVFSGTLNNAAVPNLVRITDHIFVGDTVDGGASVWLREPNADGTRAKRWKAGKGDGSGTGEELPDSWPGSPCPDTKALPTSVPIWCKCRGVDLVLRPDPSSYDDDDSKLPFFVNPATKKLLASFDVCNSCRLASGIDLSTWTFALLKQIHFTASDGSPATASASASAPFPPTTAALKQAVLLDGERDPRLGTLRLYESSAGVQRYFCSRCCAAVFYACDARPDAVDVAVGVLEGGAAGGARAEGLLDWNLGGEFDWRRDVEGGWREGFVEAVRGETERFRVERGLEVNFERRRREDTDTERKQ